MAGKNNKDAKLLDPQIQDSIVASVAPRVSWDMYTSIPINEVNFENLKTKKYYEPERFTYLNKELDSIPRKRRAAILGVILPESGGNPTKVGDHGEAYGLSQWHQDRFNRNVPEADSLDYQAKYLVGTLAGTPLSPHWLGGAYGRASKAQKVLYNENSSIDDMVKALVTGYVRPANQRKEIAERTKLAKQMYERMKKDGGVLKANDHYVDPALERLATLMKIR